MSDLAYGNVVGGFLDPSSVGFASCEPVSDGTYKLTLAETPELAVRWQVSSPYPNVVFAVTLDPDDSNARIIQSRVQGSAQEVGQFTVIVMETE